MIKVYRIEEFVINEIFRPFAPDFIGRELGSTEYQRKHRIIERTLRAKPEHIIQLLEEYPEAKREAFERINKFGINFYKYLDMDCPIIQYIKSETDRHEVTLVEMIKQLRESTGMGMMDCKKALIKTNYDMEKAKELLKEWYFSHMKLT